MSHDHQRYLVGQAIVGALINFVLNGAIGWAVYRSRPSVPLSGSSSITGDLFVTAFLLPVLVCLIATPLVRADALKGKVPPVDRAGGATLVRVLPRGLVVRAILLGLLATVTLAPLIIWALQGLGLTEMGFGQFVTLKAVFAAGLAALITPVVALRALMDAGIPASGTTRRIG